ncbi:uncharacterized protein LOC142332301 [Lycorma delicatula]|uniref:uncharacterized protein LOC142332301 n=1 Tax=Lycorma delicatula TaxID=130591 RepID=UPI003F50EB41
MNNSTNQNKDIHAQSALLLGKEDGTSDAKKSIKDDFKVRIAGSDRIQIRDTEMKNAAYKMPYMCGLQSLSSLSTLGNDIENTVKSSLGLQTLDLDDKKKTNNNNKNKDNVKDDIKVRINGSEDINIAYNETNNNNETSDLRGLSRLSNLNKEIKEDVRQSLGLSLKTDDNKDLREYIKISVVESQHTHVGSNLIVEPASVLPTDDKFQPDTSKRGKFLRKNTTHMKTFTEDDVESLKFLNKILIYSILVLVACICFILILTLRDKVS